MCGIVYSKSFTGKPVNNTIVNRYTDQRARGSEGFGFYVPQTDRLTHNPREGRILSLLKRDKADEVLFHHRFPTSTANVRNSCHPFSTKDTFDSNYIVVHNGVLQNEYELKTEHDALGYSYISEQDNGTFNDSEALAYDLARYFEGETDKITARGSIAFIAIKRDNRGKPTKLFFGRNSGNPLQMKHTANSLTLSSEGEGESIKPNMVYCYDYDTGEITKRSTVIPMTEYKSYGYDYSSWGKSKSYNLPYDEEDDVLWADRLNREDDVMGIVDELLKESGGSYYYAIENTNKYLRLMYSRVAQLDYEADECGDDSIALEDKIAEYVTIEDRANLYDEALEVLQEHYRDRGNPLLRNQLTTGGA